MRRRKNAPKRLIDAMTMAVDAIANSQGTKDGIKVEEVIYWIECRWPNHWQPNTVRSYFAQMCRPQAFRRERRGFYTNVKQGRLLRLVS